MTPTELEEFSGRVYAASKAAFSDLIKAHPAQKFYAFGLWTDDSLQFLHPAANTEEVLKGTVEHYRKTVDPKYGGNSTSAGMRWSYGDWGFFPYEEGAYFDGINKTLSANFERMLDDEAFDGELDALWDAILRGFQRLESENFFGQGDERSKITLLLVGDLPENLLAAWAMELNPANVAERYIKWDCAAPDGNE